MKMNKNKSPATILHVLCGLQRLTYSPILLPRLCWHGHSNPPPPPHPVHSMALQPSACVLLWLLLLLDVLCSLLPELLPYGVVQAVIVPALVPQLLPLQVLP